MSYTQSIHNNWKKKINPNTNLNSPLFLQVKDAIFEWINQGIRDGTLSTGDKVPSERELSEFMNVSAITVKRALNELEQEGVITRRQGLGSFISKPRKIVLGMERLYSLTTVALERNQEPSRKCLELKVISATENIAKNLEINPGDQVAKIVRLRLIDDIPLAVDTSYLPLSIFPHILEDDLNAIALYDLMTNKYKVEPIHAQEYLEPTLINEFESKLLLLPVGSAAMLIARKAFGANDIPLEYNKSVIRGDMCRFFIDMLKESL
jgi:GntR family transcriptional regulator